MQAQTAAMEMEEMAMAAETKENNKTNDFLLRTRSPL
jgi:hypothetical protein